VAYYAGYIDADHQLLTYQAYCKLLNIVRILNLIRPAKVAHLATADSSLQPYITPVVFVIEKDEIFIPLDYKPKTVAFKQLKRVKNIQKNPKVAFQVDNYEDDWQRLWFILLMGYAELVEQKEVGRDQDKYIRKVHDLFMEKYVQYSKVEIGTIFVKISTLRGFYWHYNTSKQKH
jgi:PPOX class probable F420-dependent enzyme